MGFNEAINTGTTPGDGQGDGLRTNIRKLHENDLDLNERIVTLNSQMEEIEESNSLTGSFKVGGSSDYYFPVVFINDLQRKGQIRIFRNDIHEDSNGRGTLNLLISNISPSKYGHINSYFEVSYAKDNISNLAKWTCQNNRGIETIVYLQGDTTYYYKLENVTILEANTNGSSVSLGNSQSASPTQLSESLPVTTQYLNIVENPIDSGRFVNNYYSKNSYVSETLSCTTLIQTSDKKFKSNIELIDGVWALSVFKKLNFSFYDFSKTNSKQAGLIAQEVENILPQAVHTFENGEKALNHTYVDMVCKSAIQHFIKTQIQ